MPRCCHRTKHRTATVPGVATATTVFLSLHCYASGANTITVDDRPASDASADSLAFDVPLETIHSCLVDRQPVVIGIDDDFDGDGYSIRDGDCNDCDRNTNPGAYDVPDSGVDEDCNGIVDDDDSVCDFGIPLASNNPDDGARAIGLCRFTTEHPTDDAKRSWGVIDAAFVMADGQTGMHHASRGILPDFGPYVLPQHGQAMLALSSATARRPGDAGYLSPIGASMGTTCNTPPGWPWPSPSCSVAPNPSLVANDSAALELRIRVPTNAHGLSFRFAFFTTEFPTWVCNQYNDAFVALLSSSTNESLPPLANISFDASRNPISANTTLLEACRAQVVDETAFECLLGDEMLVGNGFGASDAEPRGHGSTGWLETSSTVTPGEDIVIRFAVWDAGDDTYGSTVLVDSFRWLAESGVDPETVRVPVF